MIDWSLPAHERAALVTGVGRSPDSEGDVQEALARALWSIIVEPGDGDAGLLLGAVGAIEAARLLLEAPVPRRLVEATQGEVADARAKAAIARWLPRRRHDDLVRLHQLADECFVERFAEARVGHGCAQAHSGKLLGRLQRLKHARAV